MTGNFSAISFFPQIYPRGLHTPQSVNLAPEGKESKPKNQNTDDRRRKTGGLTASKLVIGYPVIPSKV
jgi:hypothetical protein